MQSSSFPSLPESTSPWLYFLAGSLVSTVSWWVLNRNSPNNRDDGYDSDIDSEDDDQPKRTTPNASKDWGYQDAPYKMVLVVNTSLGMGKGKIAAQCCHAAVGCYKRATKQCPGGLRAWERTGCAKIAVKCPTEEEMYEIYQEAQAKDIPLYLVEDAGRTQIAAGSRTVVGLGPAPVSVFEGVTSHLKLM